MEAMQRLLLKWFQDLTIMYKIIERIFKVCNIQKTQKLGRVHRNMCILYSFLNHLPIQQVTPTKTGYNCLLGLTLLIKTCYDVNKLF